MTQIKNDLHFAWKTVVLCLTTQVIWLTALGLTFLEVLNLAQGVFILSIAGYISFTPMHEACHGNISGKHKERKWWNSFIGNVSAVSLFIPYPIFKLLHLQHHSHTNNPELDPDYWVATRNPIKLLIKIFTIILSYYYHILFKPKTSVKKARYKVLYTIGFYFIILLTINHYTGNGLLLFYIWISSATISLAILALCFDWLPHTPHKKIGRWIDTVIIHKNWLTYPLLYQNYHLCHHLYPRVPFYNYLKLFHELEAEMESRGSKIIR